MRQRSVANCLKAADIYEAAGGAAMQLKAADALHELSCFLNALCSVLAAKVFVADGSAQQFKRTATTTLAETNLWFSSPTQMEHLHLS